MILFKLRVGRRKMDIPLLLWIFITTVTNGYIPYQMWWFFPDAIEIIKSINDPEQIYHPESDFLDLAFKIMIITSLIVSLVSFFMFLIFC